MTDKIYDTIIIGGGASGMMAGISASREGERVLIVEKNSELGKKLKITGGGRCNIYNAEYEVDKLLSHYGQAKKYLFSPFAKFGLLDTIEFFKSIGIETKVEDRKRAFPVSEKALDVFEAMHKKLVDNKVEIKLNTKIEKFILKENKVEYIQIINSEGKSEELYAKKFILSTGGMSHPETGSDGFAFQLLAKIGIKIDTFNPSLVPVSVSNNWIKNQSGKSLQNIKLTFYVDGIKKQVIKPTQTPSPLRGASPREALDAAVSGPSYGEGAEGGRGGANRILFTHFGLSGPTIINLSKKISDWCHEGEVVMKIDLFPAYDEKGLDDYLINIFDNNKNKTLKNILNDIYAGNILNNIFLDTENPLSSIDIMREVNSIKKDERRKMVNVFKNLEVNITGLMGMDKAIIADGGVSVSEVNFDNMSLKKVKNLHVTGDLLNITRPSGGYSLQLCWTTGYVAGM